MIIVSEQPPRLTGLEGWNIIHCTTFEQVLHAVQSFDILPKCIACTTDLTLVLRLEGLYCNGGLQVCLDVQQSQLLRSIILKSTTLVSDVAHALGKGAPDVCEEEPEYEPVANHRVSNREREVLGLWMQGLSNKEIAWRLGISVGTLAVHRRNLYRKTGLSTLSQLVVWGLFSGAVS